MPSSRFDIQIRKETRKPRISDTFLQKKLRQMLKALKWRRVSLSVLLVNDAAMRRLNARYLNHDRSTDVLAFGSRGKSCDRPGGIPFLGDIVISLPMAKRQSKVYGHSFLYECCFYLCHGILHLMGYRDKEAKDSRRMEKIQVKVLRKIGFREK